MIILEPDDGRGSEELLATVDNDTSLVEVTDEHWMPSQQAFLVRQGLSSAGKVICYRTPYVDYLINAEHVIEDGNRYPGTPPDDSGWWIVGLSHWTRRPKSALHEKIVDLVGHQWAPKIGKQFLQPYMKEMMKLLKQERASHTIFPDSSDVFNAYRLTGFDNIKVVILGQDPYHTPGMAHGLAFSSKDPSVVPPSLKNIYKEIEKDVSRGLYLRSFPSLERWAYQGVFLLNTILTVRKGEPASHSRIGWQNFTHKTISLINDNLENVVFMLWGNPARNLKGLIDAKRHLILEAAHPSPLSANRGFFGCKHFSQANVYLMDHGKKTVKW